MLLVEGERPTLLGLALTAFLHLAPVYIPTASLRAGQRVSPLTARTFPPLGIDSSSSSHLEYLLHFALQTQTTHSFRKICIS